MYILYYAPGSASMVVHLALVEIGVPFELRRLDFSQREQRDPAYLQLNPLGVVPTLIIDGKPRTESAALLIMASPSRYPQAGLITCPRERQERDEWLQWVVYLSNSLASAFRLWFYPADLGAATMEPEVKEQDCSARSKPSGIP